MSAPGRQLQFGVEPSDAATVQYLRAQRAACEREPTRPALAGARPETFGTGQNGATPERAQAEPRTRRPRRDRAASEGQRTVEGDARARAGGPTLGESVNLLAVDTSKPRPWLPGAARFLRPGVPTLAFATAGAGKSLAALIVGVEVAGAGGRVAYLDFENGPRRQAERLSAILGDRSEDARGAVAERFAYYPSARLDGNGSLEHAEQWAAQLDAYQLVVIDSLARALAHLGLDENAPGDFARFMIGYVDRLSARDIAVLALDNIGHDAQGRPRGASSKGDLFELVYHVTSNPIAADLHGQILFSRTRSRDGDEARTLAVGVGGGRYTRLEALDGHIGDGLLSDVEAVLRAGDHIVEDRALGREPIMAALRKRGVKGTDKLLRELVAKLASDPTTAVQHVRRRGYFLTSAGMGETAARPGLGESDAQTHPPVDGNGSREPIQTRADGPPIPREAGSGGMGAPVGSPTPPKAPAATTEGASADRDPSAEAIA